MDTLNVLAEIYKLELASANEQKVLFMAQCEIYKKQIEELEAKLKEANKEE